MHGRCLTVWLVSYIYMPSAILRDSLKPTAVCVQTDTLATILDRFQKERLNEMVVLDGQASPVGIIWVRSLLGYWFGDRPEEMLQKTVAELAGSLDGTGRSPLMDPVATLSLELTGEDLDVACRAGVPPWAVVDESGRFVGLLDAAEAWRFLAAQRWSEEAMSAESETVESRAAVWGAESVGFASSLLWETFSLLSSVEVLRRLPLPLMLQTGRGQIVVQNLAWQQRLGELENPVEVWQSAAPLLEQVPSVTGDHNSLCQLGSDQNSCDCVCAMKDGREQVWRFIKIPFGILTMGASDVASMVEPVADSYLRMDRVLHSVFHLARLGEGASVLPGSSEHPETLWLILAQDATEQHRMDQELAAKNADLVQLNRLKDEFLACISHELKTPLTSILGLSSLLKDCLIGEMNPRQLRYAQLIYQSGRHLMTIVNDILDLAQIETGQLELSLELVNVASVCDRAYEQACQHTKSVEIQEGDRTVADPSTSVRGPAFTLVIQPGLEVMIADELRLRQMLSNVLSNALKFTPETGEIGLQVERWGQWMAFTVWDTGIGIPADQQHLIFQKFQQLESPLTRQFEGTGLGLVLTQRLAHLHGGDVTFTSVEQQGSRFTILLPPIPAEAIARFTPEQLAHISVASGAIAQGLILVVESAPKLLEVLMSKLTGMGYKVAIARSGTEALEKARCLQPSVTFLNPTLPLLSGWDVLTLLKSNPSTAHIPTVVMTTPTAQQMAHHHHADEFLDLPIQDQALSDVMERLVLRRRSGLRPKVIPYITVLHLSSVEERSLDASPSTSLSYNLHDMLAPLPCRVLEVNGVEQGELLARVWKPHVILLGEAIREPDGILRQLEESPGLRRLPLVTLTVESTQAANQYPDLTVYPCLTPMDVSQSGQLSALAQVLQVATGLSWNPHVLVIDLLSQDDPEPLRLVVDGIQAEGYTLLAASSWLEIAQALQGQVTDLIVLCVSNLEAQPDLIRIIYLLEKLELRPPVIVWQSQPVCVQDGIVPSPAQISAQILSETQALLRRLERVSTSILPASTSVDMLVNQICHTLGEQSP